MVSAVIVAGGKGKRIGGDIPKQYIKLKDKEIIAYTLEAFINIEEISEIILVVPENDIEYCHENILKKYGYEKWVKIAAGGQERQDSVYNGLSACKNNDIVLIHDGARPFVSDKIIRECIACAYKAGACTAAVPVKDTIKTVDSSGVVIDTPDRSRLYAVQTPQAFKYELILNAHKKWRSDIRRKPATDDTQMAEYMGVKVQIVKGSYDNIKITTPEDIILGEILAEKLKR